jgi:hypothetical protein
VEFNILNADETEVQQIASQRLRDVISALQELGKNVYDIYSSDCHLVLLVVAIKVDSSWNLNLFSVN